MIFIFKTLDSISSQQYFRRKKYAVYIMEGKSAVKSILANGEWVVGTSRRLQGSRPALESCQIEEAEKSIAFIINIYLKYIYIYIDTHTRTQNYREILHRKQ